MWYQLKTMRLYFVKNFLLCSAIGFLAVFFVVFTIMWRENAIERDRYYSNEQNRLEHASLLFSQQVLQWQKDMQTTAALVEEHLIEIGLTQENIDKDNLIPDWHKEIMTKAGYTDFEISLDDEKMDLWLESIKFSEEILDLQESMLIVFSQAEIDALKTDAHYIRLIGSINFNNFSNKDATAYFKYDIPYSDEIEFINSNYKTNYVGHMFLADSTSNVLMKFDYNSSFIYNDKVPYTVWQLVKNQHSGIFHERTAVSSASRGVFLWTKLEIPLEDIYIAINGGVADYLVFLSEISIKNDLYNIFTDNYVALVFSAFIKSLWPFFVVVVSAVGISLVFVGRKYQNMRTKYLAEHDLMSDAYNRYAGLNKLQKILSQEVGHNEIVSICFIDINGLKEVNDQIGHDAGDELIITVSEIIRKEIRQKDFLIRMGGDEFLLVLPEVPAEQAEIVWLRIKNSFKEINTTQNRAYNISASHGITTIKPEDKNSLEEFISKADCIMYTEKRRIKSKMRTLKD